MSRMAASAMSLRNKSSGNCLSVTGFVLTSRNSNPSKLSCQDNFLDFQKFRAKVRPVAFSGEVCIFLLTSILILCIHLVGIRASRACR